MSDVLVDTSVWLDFFKKGDSLYAEILDKLLKEEVVCTTSLIKAEIISSARNRKEFNLLKDYFNALPFVQEPVTMWQDIIDYQFKLKRKGIHGVGIPDLIIVSVAVSNNKVIFTKDRHFHLIKKYIPIKLLE